MNDLVLQQAISRLLVNQYNIMAALCGDRTIPEGKRLRESMSQTSRILNAVLADDPAEATAKADGADG